jgi:hypothetical protein
MDFLSAQGRPEFVAPVLKFYNKALVDHFAGTEQAIG